MAAKRDRLAAARNYLQVFEASWKADHDQAMQCRDFEESLAEAVKVFQLVGELIRLRRESVYRALTVPNPKLDHEEKQLCMDWLGLIEEKWPRLEAHEKTYGVVEGAEEFRKCRDQARAFLTNWAPAVPAKAIGSHALEFCEEDADQLQALLQSPAAAPGRPTRPSRSVANGDPSLLK